MRLVQHVVCLPAVTNIKLHYFVTQALLNSELTVVTSTLATVKPIKGKILLYLLLSVGPGDDPGIQAVIPQW